MSTSMIEMFESLVRNPITRRLLLKITDYCEKDGASRLEVALELFAGVRDDACFKCKLAEKTVAKVVRSGASAFGADEEGIMQRLKDPYWRKGLASVVKGLALFGVRKPFVPGAPFQVVWDFTYACNLKCKHCYASAGVPLADELSTEEALALVDKLAKWGVTILAFSGGEPLVRRDFYQVARRAAVHGMYVAVATNGTLITKEVAKRLKEAGVQYLQISLDGATPETHDRFRGIPGVFEKTIEGIKNAVAEGFFVNIATTATKENYKEIPDIIDLCEELGVNWFMMYNFVPTGRGRFIVENDLTPEEREELLKLLWNKLKSVKKLNVLSTAPQFARVAIESEACAQIIPTHFYNPHLPDRLQALSDFIGGCGAGRFYIAIRPNGDIEPCVFFPLKVGNVREDDLETLWRTSKVFEELRNRDLLKPHCGICEYRYKCGGCRARAYGYFNDYLAPDPGCILNRSAYQSLVSQIAKI